MQYRRALSFSTPSTVLPFEFAKAPMRSRKKLFTVTALIEVGAGLSLLSLPGLAIRLLFGVRESSLEALVVGRIGGAALLALGVACYLARDDPGSRSQYGLLWAMLIYNVGACVGFAFAGLIAQMTGVVFWPGAALHAAIAIWFVVTLRASAAKAR
jgi:hypothetical protein